MTILDIFDNGCSPNMGETQEAYEKRKIRDRLRLIERAKNPDLRPTGLGMDPMERKVREEADRIYNERHSKFRFKKTISQKDSTR